MKSQSAGLKMVFRQGRDGTRFLSAGVVPNAARVRRILKWSKFNNSLQFENLQSLLTFVRLFVVPNRKRR